MTAKIKQCAHTYSHSLFLTPVQRAELAFAVQLEHDLPRRDFVSREEQQRALAPVELPVKVETLQAPEGVRSVDDRCGYIV